MEEFYSVPKFISLSVSKTSSYTVTTSASQNKAMFFGTVTGHLQRATFFIACPVRSRQAGAHPDKLHLRYTVIRYIYWPYYRTCISLYLVPSLGHSWELFDQWKRWPLYGGLIGDPRSGVNPCELTEPGLTIGADHYIAGVVRLW